MLSSHRHVLSQLEAQLGLAVDDKSVSQIGGVVGLVIVVTIVAQQRADTIALGIESGYLKGIALVNQRLRLGTFDKTVSMSGESEISDAVETIETARGDGIAYLCRLGILLLDDIIRHTSVEIAMIAENRLGHLSTQLGINPRHEDRLLAKTLEHPLAKARLRALIVVPHADTKREGQTMIGAAEDGTIGRSSQRCLDLSLG